MQPPLSRACTCVCLPVLHIPINRKREAQSDVLQMPV